MKKSVVQIAATNLRAAREARGIESYRALAAKAKVAPNTVKNMENPDDLAPNARGGASPRLDVLEKLAHAMGFETWHLLTEGFDPHNPPPLQPPTDREIKTHRQIEAAYKALRGDDAEPVT